MSEIWLALKDIDPRLPYLLIAAIVGLVILGWRKLHPESFHQLPKALQTIPGVIIGSVLAAASTDDATIKGALLEAFFGAISGFTASGGYGMLKHMVPGVGANAREKEAKGE